MRVWAWLHDALNVSLSKQKMNLHLGPKFTLKIHKVLNNKWDTGVSVSCFLKLESWPNFPQSFTEICHKGFETSCKPRDDTGPINPVIRREKHDFRFFSPSQWLCGREKLDKTDLTVYSLKKIHVDSSGKSQRSSAWDQFQAVVVLYSFGWLRVLISSWASKPKLNLRPSQRHSSGVWIQRYEEVKKLWFLWRRTRERAPRWSRFTQINSPRISNKRKQPDELATETLSTHTSHPAASILLSFI